MGADTALAQMSNRVEWLRQNIAVLQPAFEEATSTGNTEQLMDIYSNIINAKLRIGTSLVSGCYSMSLIADNEREECEKSLRLQYRQNVRDGVGDIRTLHDANDQAFLDCSEKRMYAIACRSLYESAKELSQIIRGLEISISHAIGEAKN
jgi:hypothetical protein